MIAFFTIFIIYLITLFPGLAPYRDTGEMVSVAHTLGVAHPPGYPFYILVSKVFMAVLGLGNLAWRMNVLSALAGALAVWAVYRLFLGMKLTRTASFFLSVLFGTSYLQWYLSLVQEMYTLNILFASVLILLVHRAVSSGAPSAIAKRLYFISFIFGIGLGCRMDLLMLAPGLVFIVFSKRKELKAANIAAALLFFGAGFSVYLYLMLRSGLYPMIDWNHPGTFKGLLSSLMRKTHGGTLDLISTNYAPGENFISTLGFYFAHLARGSAYAGLALGAFGAWHSFRRNWVFAVFLLASWFFSGPLFIYLANMPPNPHALAILEAHFLLPNLFFAVWIGEGFLFLWPRIARIHGWLPAAAVLCLVLLNLKLHCAELNKRDNFIAYDYSKNVLRSLPKGSVVVMKKDVQLFSVWNKQFVEKKRPDLLLVSQGLAGSPWYQKVFHKYREPLFLCRLDEPEDWARFAALNPSKRIFHSLDADYRHPDGYAQTGHGLVAETSKENDAGTSGVLLEHVYPFRGKYDYPAYREFFTPDLIEEYVKAFLNFGINEMNGGRSERALKNMEQALAFKPLFPIADNYIAFIHFNAGRHGRAEESYVKAARGYGEMVELAEKYNALESVASSMKRSLSDVYISLGVCREKASDDGGALGFYTKALESDPSQARAYFNRAVIYWKKNDWRKVVAELENALRINPNYAEAAYYLEQAKNRLRN
ncbi:MAG: DUF2723 domain-containing protein [Endomicrobiales bacterium]|nr:DUF2723 domain-containing protein [Endomicrobiales bacterium]